MPTVSLNLIVLRSADLDRAAHFYSALGVRLARERHGSGPEHLAADLGGIVFEIYPVQDEPTTAVRVGFRVPSLAETLAAVVAVGGVVVTPAREGPWGRRAVVADPDGHRVELIEAGT